MKIEANYDGMNTLGGFDIRRQDMPFPSNNMDATRASLSFQYYIPFVKESILSVLVSGSQVLTGRNMGQSTAFSGGLTYQFGLWK
ncbi:MAG: hypothetical protein IPM82_08910 [Saprospiraceae bacterium]|nr:hypothetical protein [Saprospiraceae bacterium]